MQIDNAYVTLWKRQVVLFVCLAVLVCCVAGTNTHDLPGLPAVVLVFCIVLVSRRAGLIPVSCRRVLYPYLGFVSLRAPPQN